MKYIIFDFGQVLVRFEPSYMVGKYVSDPVEAALLAHIVFDRKYWDRLDAGTITDAEVVEDIKTRVPARLGDAVELIYYNWIYNIPEVEGMREVIEHVKSTYGAPVYLLSNISVYFAEHAGEIPILSHFDKCVFSAVCGKIKPNRDIFEYLCAECGLVPGQTLFVDDNPGNIAGAEAFGIKGYLFNGDADKLKKFIEKELG